MFFLCILQSVLLFYDFVSLPSVSSLDVLKLKTLEFHAPAPLTVQLAPAVILMRPDERGEQEGTLHSGSSNGSDKPVL